MLAQQPAAQVPADARRPGDPLTWGVIASPVWQTRSRTFTLASAMPPVRVIAYYRKGAIPLSAAPSTPVVIAMEVVPVAGRDSMLLNLSGAHGPFFTRNIVRLTDSSGNTGVGEVPGGEPIRQTLEDAKPM